MSRYIYVKIKFWVSAELVLIFPLLQVYVGRLKESGYCSDKTVIYTKNIEIKGLR